MVENMTNNINNNNDLVNHTLDYSKYWYATHHDLLGDIDCTACSERHYCSFFSPHITKIVVLCVDGQNSGNFEEEEEEEDDSSRNPTFKLILIPDDDDGRAARQRQAANFGSSMRRNLLPLICTALNVVLL